MAEESKQQEQKKAAFVSLRVKLLIGLTLVVSGMFVGAFLWFSKLVHVNALRQVEEDLRRTLVAAADRVDSETLASLANDAYAIAERAAEEEGLDNEERFTRAQEELAGDPRVELLLNQLEDIHEIEYRAWPYIYIPGYPGDENSYIPVADLWSRYDPDRAYDFLDYSISSKGYLIRGFDELFDHPDNETGGYQDEWGEWITAYAPILNENGQPVGAIGVDFEASYVRQVTREAQRRLPAVFIVGYVILVAAVFVVAIAFTRPISTLAAAAERIGEGDYDQDIADMSVGPFRDELTTFSDVFEIMMAKVRQREQTLRRQVEELRIMVDEQKRREQVAEIVDTDFFRDLRSKARTMRARGTRTDRGE